MSSSFPPEEVDQNIRANIQGFKHRYITPLRQTYSSLNSLRRFLKGRLHSYSIPAALISIRLMVHSSKSAFSCNKRRQVV